MALQLVNLSLNMVDVMRKSMLVREGAPAGTILHHIP
jgi:hypothetical protein